MPIQIRPAKGIIKAGRDPLAYWPSKPEDQSRRLSPMCLPAIRPSFSISKDDLIFTIGSCFARNVEKELIVEGFNVAAKEFPRICAEEGVKYHDDIMNKFVSGSIFNEVKWALNPNASYDERSIVPAGNTGRWVDMHIAPTVIPAKLDVVQKTRRAVSRYMAMLKDAKIVVITLGLAEAWHDNELGIYLNRAPQPSTVGLFPDRYSLHVLSYQDIVDALEGIISHLERFGREDFRMVLTVSPVALGATWTTDDVIVANCYSKSVQRAAAGYIAAKYECVDYLPSYESVTLSERRIAWQEDQAHVSDEAVRMNVLRMLYAYAGIHGNDEADQKRAIALQLVRDARDARRSGRREDGKRALELALEAAPHEVTVQHELGASLVAEARFAEAVTHLEIAHSLGGGQYGATELLGFALTKVGRAKEAIPLLEEAVGLNLRHTKAPRYLAEAYAMDGQVNRAIEYLSAEAIPNADAKAGLAFLAASLLEKLGRLEDALEMAQVALDEKPEIKKYAEMHLWISGRIRS